jgi:hypothetical protein
MQFLLVPAGGTGRLQPLDPRIFNELKSRARLNAIAFSRRAILLVRASSFRLLEANTR